MTGPTHSQQELVAVSDHLGYEIWMLRQTASKLAGMQPGVDRNAVLESFTIHARALCQFFEPTRPKPHDALAWQYVGDEAKWEKARGAMPGALADVNGRVGSEIVHLSCRRLKFGPVADQWNITRIHDALMRVVATFIAVVPAANLSDTFRELTARPPVLTFDATELITSSTNAPTMTSTMVNSISPNSAHQSGPPNDNDPS